MNPSYEEKIERAKNPSLAPEHRLHYAISAAFDHSGESTGTFQVLRHIAMAGLEVKDMQSQ